ncbi:rad50 subfamily protein [Pelomyxa schiedti]|nr:rad50 subfamily protein [Pelomyxa schiedti]
MTSDQNSFDNVHWTLRELGGRQMMPKDDRSDDKPLTLIVGENGAGKTTVIECLKYACTGEFPPNAKSGQAFVHDTRVADLREVKAQIRLNFIRNNKPVTVVRNLQLTQKAVTQQFKTLESSLQMYNSAGELVAESLKCASLDRAVPMLMGVSKPILDNVIFCHQEDSHWPFESSSRKLKEKFDAIFSATRYNKALQEIKDLRKKQMDIVKESRLKLETLGLSRENALKLRSQQEDCNRQIISCTEQAKAINEERAQMTSQLNHLKGERQAYCETTQALSNLKMKRTELLKTQTLTLQDISEELTCSDSELNAMQTKFERESSATNNSLHQLKQRKSDLEVARNKINQQQQKINTERGRLQATNEHLKAVRKERDVILLQFLKKYQLETKEVGPDFLDQQATQYIELCSSKFKILLSKLEEMRVHNATKRSEMDNKIVLLKQQCARQQECMAQNTKSIKEKQSKQKQIESEVKQLTAQMTKFKQLEMEIEEKENRKHILKSAFDPRKIESEIASLRDQKAEIDREQASLSEAMKVLNMQGALRARINVKRNDKQTKQDTFQRKLLASEEKLKNLLQVRILPSPEVILQKITELKELQEKKTETAHQQEPLYLNLKPACKFGEDLPALIIAAEQTTAKLNKEIALANQATNIYENYIELANEAHLCPLCERPFETPKNFTDFVQKLHQIKEQAPKSTQDKEVEVTEAESRLALLKGMRTPWENANRLHNTEIPELKAALQRNEAEIKLATSDLERLTAELATITSQTQRITAVFGETQEICRLFIDVSTADKDLQAEEAKLKETSSDTRTLEELSASYEKSQARSLDTNNKIDNLRNMCTTKSAEISECEQKISALKEEALRLQSTKDTITRLQSTQQEISGDISRLGKECYEAESGIAEKSEEIETLTKEKENFQAEISRTEEELLKKKDAFQQVLGRLQSLEKLITKDSVAQASLKQLDQSSKDLSTDLENNEKELNAIISRLSAAEQGTDEQERYKRNVSLNVRLRGIRRDIKAVEDKIRSTEEEMSKQIGRDSIDSEIEQCEKNLSKANSNYDQLQGSLKTLQENLKQITADLRKPSLQHVDEEYKNMLIKHKTTEVAQGDLDKYYKALDAALMRYHTLKMEDINNTMRELWQSTYRGNDIDAIQIKTDMESDSKKKSYNYRVVMAKAGVELDMAGRCSAGQKVLASLIIRMALAETFCVNCGILSLDEPTTNLDRRNVESFAAAISRILDRRHNQASFQLIIITHDEEFVQLLARNQYANCYWRVSKNANGHSTLEMKDFKDLV